MIKVFALIPRRPDISVEEFHDHWRHPHGDLALNIETLLGYVQSHRVDAPGPGLADSRYEGIAEVWFVDLATAAGMGEDPNYVNGCAKDEPLMMDMPHLAFFMADAEVLTDDGEVGKDDGGIKLLQLIKATDGDAWATDEDKALGEALGVIRHVRSRPNADAYAEGEPPYDGIRELRWADRAAMEAGIAAAPDAWKALLAEPVGVGPDSVAMLAEEDRVLWPVTSTPVPRTHA